MESSCEKMGNREISSSPPVTTSSITEATVTISTASTVKDEPERCSQSSLSSETNEVTKKCRTSSSTDDQEKDNDNQQLSKCHSSGEKFEETNTCLNSGTNNCDDNKKSIYYDESSSDIHQKNGIKNCDIVGSNDEQISLNVDSQLCETESTVDNTDSINSDSSKVTTYATKLSSMETSPIKMMLKDSDKDESEHDLQVSSPASASEIVNPQTITTEKTRSPTSVIVKATTKKATATTSSSSTSTTTATTTAITKSSLLSSESSLKTVTMTKSTAITTVHCESKHEEDIDDENKIGKDVNNIVIKEELRSNHMDECDDSNINDLKKQELCSSDSTNSTAINDTKCNSSSSESSNGDSVIIQKSVQTSPLSVDDPSTATVQKNIETYNFSNSYVSKDNDKSIKNSENSNDGEAQGPEVISIEKTPAISTSTTEATTKAETTKTTLSATVEPAVDGISFGLDNILSKAKTLQSNSGIEISVSSLNPCSSLLSQHLISTKNDIITMSTSPKDLDKSSLQKPGKWNTMHVRISWEILRQQKASLGEKSNTNSPLSTSFNLKSPAILPPNPSSVASASSIALPSSSKNSHLSYDLIRPPTTSFGNTTSVLQTPQSQQQQNQFQPQLQSHTLPQPPPLHRQHQQNQSQPLTPHLRSLDISSFSASLMNAASGGLNTRVPLDSNLWNQRSLFGPVSLASGHLPYPSLQTTLSSSSLSFTSGSSIPQSLALSSSSSTSSVSTPSITAPISSLGKINGNNDILRSTNSIFGLPPRPGEMTPFSTSLYNAAVAAGGGHRPGLEAWNSPFAPGSGMSSIAAHNFIRSSLPGFPGFPHPHSPHNNLGLPSSVPTSMSNNLFANLAPPLPPQTPRSSSAMDSLLNTSGRPVSSMFPPISSSSGCGPVPLPVSGSSSSSTSWGGLKAEAEKSESSKHKEGSNRSISSRSKDEIRSDSHHPHHSHRSSSNSSNNKVIGSKHSSISSSSSNHNGDSESSHRREREKSHSNSHKREYSRPSSVNSVSSGNKIMKTSSAFNDNRSSHTNESKTKDDRRESMNNYNKYFERSHKHSSNSIDHPHRDLKSASLLSSSIGVFNNSNSASLFSTASTASFNNSIMSIPTPPGLPPSITPGNNHSSAASLASMNLHVNNAMDHRARLMGLFGLSHGPPPPPPPSTPSLCHSMPPSPHGLPGHLSHPNSGSGIPSGLAHDFPKSFWSPFFQPHPGFHEFPPRNDFFEREHLLQQYNILNSSGGGAPLTEKLAKEGPLHALLDKESRDKEVASFASVFDKTRLAPSSIATSTSSSTSSSVNAHLITPNPPSLASPFGGPSTLSHGPGNLGLGHALPPPPPPPPLPPLSQSHPHSHPSSPYHHQLHQQHHQTSPGQPPTSSSSVLMFPPNPYLNSLHSLSASAGSNVRTDLNNRTKSMSSSSSPSSAPSIKQYPHHGAAHSSSPMFIPPLNGLTGPHGFIPPPLINSKLSTLDTSFEVNCVNRSTISMSNPSTPASGISLADLKESKSR